MPAPANPDATSTASGAAVTPAERVNNGRVGSMLAVAREAAGLELTDVARTTRVPLRHLKAIEADTHESLPALPYSVGFVKAYAQAVGLNGDAMAQRFRAETSQQPHVPTMSLEPMDARRLPSQSLAAISIGAIVLVIAGLSAWGAGMFDKAPPAVAVAAPGRAADTPVAAPDAAPAAVGGTTAAAGDAAPLASGPAATGPAPAPAIAVPAGGGAIAAGGPVVLTAREDVWIKIYDRTTRASAKIGVLKTGESYTVPADQPGLLLWTGKAGAIDVKVGGRAIPPLGGPVQTVRDISLMPADLMARAAAAPAAVAVAPGAAQ